MADFKETDLLLGEAKVIMQMLGAGPSQKPWLNLIFNNFNGTLQWTANKAGILRACHGSLASAYAVYVLPSNIGPGPNVYGPGRQFNAYGNVEKLVFFLNFEFKQNEILQVSVGSLATVNLLVEFTEP